MQKSSRYQADTEQIRADTMQIPCRYEQILCRYYSDIFRYLQGILIVPSKYFRTHLNLSNELLRCPSSHNFDHLKQQFVSELLTPQAWTVSMYYMYLESVITDCPRPSLWVGRSPWSLFLHTQYWKIAIMSGRWYMGDLLNLFKVKIIVCLIFNDPLIHIHYKGCCSIWTWGECKHQ